MRPYRFLFWGFLLSHLLIIPGVFRVLFSFIGGILLAYGVIKLRSRQGWFRTITPLAIVLALAPAFNFIASTALAFGRVTFQFFPQTSPATQAPAGFVSRPIYHSVAYSGSALAVLGLVLFAMDLVTLYGICKGTAMIAREMDRHDLASMAMRRFKYWVIYLLIAFLAPLFLLGVLVRSRSSIFPLVSVVSLIILADGLIVLILFLIFLWKADVLAREPQPVNL
ncbi:MAG: hypothetical protein ACYDCC_00895 [Actinomycetota bacterium]